MLIYMLCNKLQKPDFTKEQIAECQSCRWISGKKRWCCHFGVWIIEAGTIIQPSKKIIRPQPKLPPMRTMAKNFAGVAIKYARSGFKNRTPAEQQRCKDICHTRKNGKPCEFFIADSRLGERCSQCGCCINLATLWASKDCPKNYWPK
jgi:hypothetical protein